MPTKQNTPQKPSNWLKIELGYHNTLILPYSDGIAFMSSLAYAESIDSTDWELPLVRPLDKAQIETSIVSHQEYLNMKADAIIKGDKKDDAV